MSPPFIYKRLPFIYKPRPGEEISISRDPDGRCAIVVTSGTRTVSARILAEEAPGFAVAAARAICEAAGKPEPVILERPDGQDLSFRAIRIGRNGNAVLLAIGGNQEALSPLLARELAANLVTLAEEADGEPDPAEVGELAALMDAEMDRRANGQSGLYPAVARIALQWMNGRQQRGERP